MYEKRPCGVVTRPFPAIYASSTAGVSGLGSHACLRGRSVFHTLLGTSRTRQVVPFLHDMCVRSRFVSPPWHVQKTNKKQVCIVHIHRGLAKAATLDWLIGGQPLLHTLEAMPAMHLARRAAEWASSSEIPGLGGGLKVRSRRLLTRCFGLHSLRCVHVYLSYSVRQKILFG